jgi:hypothetical protein
VLEFGAVSACLLAQRHQLKCAIEASIMIRRDVSDEVGGLIGPDQTVTDAESRHGRLLEG